MSFLEMPPPNNTNFPLVISNALSSLDLESSLKPHQIYASQYFIRNEKLRGLLYCASMGQGKTIGAAAIVHHFATQSDRRIVFLSAKSLHANFASDYLKYLKMLGQAEEYERTLQAFNFISLNSSRMFQSIGKLDEDKSQFEKDLGMIVSKETAATLENSLLVVDEAHNLFNAITNGSANAMSLYDMIMHTKNIKLLFLSGTPMVNHPFELVPAFNMLSGELRFAESFDEFVNFFVDTDAKTTKNRHLFEHRILGMIAYYGDLYTEKNERPGFPKVLPTIVERVPMSTFQYGIYATCRDQEKAEEASSRQQRPAEGRFKMRGSSSSTYRVKSRQASNYALPEYAIDVEGNKFISRIKREDLLDTARFSPKMNRILTNISKSKGKGMVYSQFVSGEGIGVFARILDVMGYKCYNEMAAEASQLAAYDMKISDKPMKVYGLLTGDVDSELRADIIRIFNSAENKNGEIIGLMLLSGAVAEGISLMHIRHIHIMEPFWNMARIEQVQTRGVRFNSHEDLPTDQRDVQTFIYLSDYAEKKKNVTENTTDVELYSNAVINKQIINNFMISLANASIDCTQHYKSLPEALQKHISCVMCAPTNTKLFGEIHQDVQQPSPCRPLTMIPMEVKKIDIDGIEYRYTHQGDIVIYHYDDSIKGFIRMPANDPDFAKVYSKILAEEVEFEVDF